MANKKVYYQGCISPDWRTCFYMECADRDKCPQFKEYEKDITKNYFGKERLENENL